MRLASFIEGRNNNFNLIRMIAAYAVLVTHSFALVIGTGNAEPLQATLGMTIGSIAVDIFFLTSGFLVTASLLTRQSTIEFVWARVLRIYPALFAMHLLAIFGLGLFFTTLSWPSYFADPLLYKYLLKCLTLFSGSPYELPGVFSHNPYGDSINSSLWTIPYEIAMYTILSAIWVSLRAMPQYRQQAFNFVAVSGASLSGILIFLSYFNATAINHFIWLFFLFFTGSTFFILRNRIVLSHSIFFILLFVLLLASLNRHAFFIIYAATLAYILFYVAYIPSGMVRKYNKLGDYSYGFYIYAFPVQQSIAALLPGVSVLTMVIISSAVTLLLAVLSWHFLEKHALDLKGHYVNHTKKLLSFFPTSKSTS
ncbi:acyltransferase [Ferrovum sp.]|uniref:acyltransferase family protein n=1 Tax=Ferrovum sp. TaxID=2609467 RepID=UPI0026072CF5|nr:acyltransferase [Ferrovum sp.]